MAEKPSSSKPSKKTSSKSPTGKSGSAKKTNSTGKSTAKSTTPKGSSANRSNATTKSKSTAKSNSTGKNNHPRSAAPQENSLSRLQRWLTFNRSLDIIGILSVFIGLITLLSLLSANNSALTGGILAFLRRLFGAGVYVFPIVMLAAGLWLILRNFERVPQLTLPRATGFTLLFLNFITWLTFIWQVWIAPGVNPYDLAKLGRGGGYVGAFFYSFLVRILGVGGTAIALVAWLLVALVLAFDISVLDLFARVAGWFRGLENRVLELFAGSRASSQIGQTPPIPSEVSAGRAGQSILPGQIAPAIPQDFQSFLPPSTIPGITQPVWVLPALDQVLEAGVEVDHDDDVDRQRSHLIEETLASFGAPVRVVEVNRGPTITQFGVEPNFIESRSGRTRLRDVIESDAFRRLKSPLRFALGQNVSGQAVAADLAGMPHLLIAGQTGSGKSVCVNSLICCLLANNTPDDLRLIMVDPKRVELTGYNGIPHLLAPVVVELERVVAALQWVMREMDMRYRKLAEAGSRNIQDYNAKRAALGQAKLPYLVVIIDELADLMMLAPDETERTITRLAQLARATGIHLVIATQRPSVDVVTGLIKANFPARIAFAVASNIDSRVILDQPGAETLLGRGDMLFQAPDSPAPVRLQGVYVSDAEILHLVAYWQQFAGLIQPAPTAIEGYVDGLPTGIALKQMSFWETGAPDSDEDPVLAEAIDLARRQGRASISMLQRRLRIGYTRAARLIETMEEKGIVGSPDPGSGVREILDYGPAGPPVDDN
ncbi:MAG: segregation ATPase FtsK/SpoIIIE, family [Chloroflexi bacterium]|nr:segregation ATPase FtsK/SpoIIIE, family [Chloroflexota bacterium]